jgi:arylsulfatase A-like enzyme
MVIILNHYSFLTEKSSIMAEAMNKQRKNILLITSDQQHYMTLGINNPVVKTPNLDRLAAGGTVFDRAYTCNPTCTPTRA